jgi:periplasmic protein TonB
MELKKNPSKDIHQYSGMFFFLGLGISIALVIVAFEWRTLKTNDVVYDPNPIENQLVAMIDPVVTSIQPDVPKPDVIRHVANFIPSLNETPSQSPEPTIDLNPIESSLPVSTIPPDDVEVDTSFVFCGIVEKMPQPIGGYPALYQFLSKEMKYPSRAKRNDVQGSVYVEFTLNKQGKPKDVKIVKGIGSGCDEEAARAIALTEWEPGKQRGKPVNVKMVFPVKFKIE